MLAGMAIGMTASMTPLAAGAAACAGALLGVGVVGVTYLANARISGRVTEWTS
jgi:hypothetical protein